MAFDEIDQHKKSKVSAKGSTKPRPKVQANFVEDDQLVLMEVHVGDESLFQMETSDSESDNPVPNTDSQDGEDPNMLTMGSGRSTPAHDEEAYEFLDSGPDPQVTNHRQCIQEIDEEMAEKLSELKSMMIEGGLTDSVRILQNIKAVATNSGKKLAEGKKATRENKNKNTNASHRKITQIPVQVGPSEETIYKNAIEKRGSTSSEDNDTSGEFVHALTFHNVVDLPPAPQTPPRAGRRSRDNDDPVPSTSGQDRQAARQRPVRPPPEDDSSDDELTPEERAEQLIHEAERAKAKIFSPKGNRKFSVDVEQNISQDLQAIVLIDQDYQVVGAHVDESLKQKIIEGQYIDFGKLIPKDKILSEEDGRMELVIRNGKSFWTPVSESVTISNFARWEQAFRVFSNVYTGAHPQKSGDLIQYNHIIHSISLSYLWENVYSYDKEFRLHMSRHPDRSWAVILQQAWSMKLRDRISKSESADNRSYVSSATPKRFNGDKSPKYSDYCKRFNRGKCNLGSGCRFEHRCSYCDKFGHGVLVCRKLVYDKSKNGSKKESGNSANNSFSQNGNNTHNHNHNHQSK